MLDIETSPRVEDLEVVVVLIIQPALKCVDKSCALCPPLTVTLIPRGRVVPLMNQSSLDDEEVRIRIWLDGNEGGGEAILSTATAAYGS
jgi:hypothetical protein